MGDGDPFPAKLVTQFHGVAKLFLQVGQVSLRQIVGGPTLFDQGMGLALKENKIGLAHHGGIAIVHKAGQNVTPHGRVGFLAQQAFEEQHLGKDGSGLGHGQGGVEGQDRMLAGHQGVHGVAQLVGQGCHVVRLAVIVDQYPRGEARQGAGAKRAPGLARADLGIEVAFDKDAPGVAGQRGRKAVEAVEHHPGPLGKGIGLVRGAEGRIDVVAAQLVQAEPAGLETEITLEQGRVLAADLEQDVDRGIGNVVAQVADGNGRGKAA